MQGRCQSDRNVSASAHLGRAGGRGRVLREVEDLQEVELQAAGRRGSPRDRPKESTLLYSRAYNYSYNSPLNATRTERLSD